MKMGRMENPGVKRTLWAELRSEDSCIVLFKTGAYNYSLVCCSKPKLTLGLTKAHFSH